MSSRATAENTQRELSYRKRLIEIANLINSAPAASRTSWSTSRTRSWTWSTPSG